MSGASGSCCRQASVRRTRRVGAVLTAAGAFLYLYPGPGLPLLALGALALAASVAVWLSSRQH